MGGTIDYNGLTLDAPGRGRVYGSILETVGNTPIVRVPRLSEEEGLKSHLLLKLEFFNPLASVKDRIAIGMITQLEKDGIIGPGTVLIEPTSGNTGIGLAMVAAARGYRLILTMPESMSIERRKMLAILGAELYLTPKEKGIKGTFEKASELLAQIPGSVMPSQFDNPANPAIHEATTAEEIWRDTGGAVDAVVAGVGTGGTFTGNARVLKAKKPSVKMFAVEPEASPVLSGGEPGPHVIQGIGAGFIPANMDTSLIDGIVKVSNDDAIAMARRVARTEGVPVGISSGAALKAGLEVAKRSDMLGKTIVVIIPSFAERYVSTLLFDGLG
ncbi:MAG: cysteine synthase A [Alphaproteobacteria bacterium]|nr:cysteine synthase A [Alphaproteobacteria bacterium]MBU2084839.1 cysteine synthase A [Alphaproteobacteria bacterium]MBU2144083.1 cysteine synthase A [Alphaproteobacteria bacterium]MBU2198198.1 cysteine synthase A [Alphaproteobacteria bacterium]